MIYNFQQDRVMKEHPPMPPGGDFVFFASEMSFGGKLVKGAPYSAEAVTESTQTLSDGNRIVNKSTSSIYRDSEGRTRREQTLRAIGPFASDGAPWQTIHISDPVAAVSYVLDPRAQVARKMPPMRSSSRSVSADELAPSSSRCPTTRHWTPMPALIRKAFRVRTTLGRRH